MTMKPKRMHFTFLWPWINILNFFYGLSGMQNTLNRSFVLCRFYSPRKKKSRNSFRLLWKFLQLNKSSRQETTKLFFSRLDEILGYFKYFLIFCTFSSSTKSHAYFDFRLSRRWINSSGYLSPWTHVCFDC